MSAARVKVFDGWVLRPATAPPRQDDHRGTQVRFALAAPSQAKAAAALQVSVNHLRNYCSVTANATDIAQAMNEPGVVFWRELDDHKRTGWRRAVVVNGRLTDQGPTNLTATQVASNMEPR